MKLIENGYTVLLKQGKVLFFIFSIVFSWIEATNRSDFQIYLLASQDLVHGINPYSHSYIDGYYYYYSLLFAYVLYPFIYFDNYWSNFIWLMLNSVFLYNIFVKIHRFLNVSTWPPKKQILYWLLLLLFNMRTIRENYHSAQVTILILYFMLYSFDFLLKEKFFLSALFLALAINIKLLALPLLVYFVYRGYWKAFLYSVGITLFLFVIPVLWMKLDFYLDCMYQWYNLINPNNDKHLIDVEERSFHSITTLITTLFMKNPPDIYALPIRRYIIDLNPVYVKTLIQVVRLLLILSVLYIVRDFPFRKINNPLKAFFEVSYIIALVPLIFPHQQHYAFLLQLPALVILIYISLHSFFSKIEWGIFVLIFLFFNLKIILGAFNDYYEHFKILTHGGLLTLIMLVKIYNRVTLNKKIELKYSS